MLEFARVASGGSYGDYKGCKSLQSKLEKYKLMTKDLNKHRQVKSVDSNSIIPANRVLPVKLRSRADVIFEIIDMEEKYPNDTDLGRHVRQEILSWKEE
tara:strand:- start:251 stop:547 length:297 start_codon:yes stop_codon:yes gene_type:complete